VKGWLVVSAIDNAGLHPMIDECARTQRLGIISQSLRIGRTIVLFLVKVNAFRKLDY
jgi:hypothetical protein